MTDWVTLPEHGERANGSAILVLVFEARVIAVMFSNFGLEDAAQRGWIVKWNGRETRRHGCNNGQEMEC